MKKRVCLYVILAIALALGVFQSAAAATPIFVRPDGDDLACNGTVDADASAAPACAVKTIQKGISLADAGGVVNVAAGTYNEEVNINKQLTLQGAGIDQTIIAGPKTGGVNTLIIGASGSIVDGVTVTRDGNNVTDWPTNAKNQGVIFTSSNSTLRNSKVTGNRNGVYLNNVQGNTVRNNIITFNRTGIQVANNVSNLVITENEITDNWTMGLLFNFDTGGVTSGVQVTNNNISGNWYGDVFSRYTNGAARLNVSGNWFGTTAPVITTAASTEPGYTAQIPAAYGGDAANPGGAPNIGEGATNLLDYSPWLNSGTDTAPASLGFQGDFSNLWVDAVSPIAGSATGNLQDGIDTVTAGGTVHASAGTYVENDAAWRDLHITKSISLIGVGSGSAIVQLSEGKTNGLEIYGSGLTVTVEGLGFTRDPAKSYGPGFAIRVGETASAFTALTFRDVDVSYAKGRALFLDQNGAFPNVLLENVNLHHNGAWGFTASGDISGLNVVNSHFDNNGSDDPNHGIGFDISPATGKTIQNVTVTGGTFNGNTSKGINLVRLTNATFSGFTANDNVGTGNNGYGVSLWEWSGATNNLTFQSFDAIGNSRQGMLFGSETGKTVSNVTVKNARITGNTGDGILFYREAGWAEGAFTNITVAYSDVSGNDGGGIIYATPNSTVKGICNWWGDLSGPTIADNPGGLGEGASANITYSPWLIDPAAADGDPAAPGLQLPTGFDVIAGADASAADNNYRTLANAIGCVTDNQTINLSGVFDFSQPNALASWPLGTDAVAGTNDDWEVDVPANADGVTLTAVSLGDAIIQGPGDIPTVDLEGFLQFYNNGTNQNWTISKLDIRNFDLSIGMYCCGGSPSTAYNGTTITGNHILMATDLKGESASGNETLQNIGLHLAYGKNQTITNNTFDVPGDGLSDAATDGLPWYGAGSAASWMYAVDVVMQSNTSGGNAYDGLLIDHNTVRVLNAPSAYPQKVIGLWENAHGHSSNITLSNNTFVNLDAGNNPFVNRQMAFRPTSHSSASTAVQYTDNQITDWAIGFYPMSVSAGNLPIQMTRNQITGAQVGYLLGPNENWNITDSALSNPIYVNSGIGVFIPSTAQAALNGVSIESFDTGMMITGTTSVAASHLRYNQTGVLLKDSGAGSFNGNEFAGNIDYAINNTTGAWVDANNSWWGDTTGPMDPEPPCADGECNTPGLGDRVSDYVHYAPYTSAPNDVSATFTTQAEPVKAILNWETTTEEFILHFNAYRADSETGPRTLLSPSDIPAQHTGQAVGDSYTLTDAGVTAGSAYYYWLEIVDTNGRSTFIGPRVQYIKQASSLGLVSSKNPSVLGETVTFTATLGQVDATGVITFTADGATLPGCGGLAVASGKAACAVGTLTVGAHPVAAIYGGDAVYFGSAAPALGQVVGQKASSLALASSKNPALVGETVTFTATLGQVDATGVITFTADGATLPGCGGLAVASGKAACTTASLSAGTHPITAVYGGDSAYLGSTASSLNQVINKKASSLALASSKNPALVGETVTFTATVTLAAARPEAAAAITFQADGADIAGCVAKPVSGGKAVCALSGLAAGAHAITASYSGDDASTGSDSAALQQVINKKPSSLTLVSSLNPARLGDPLVFTATLAQADATGTITFQVDGADIAGCVNVAVTDGKAICTTNALPGGDLAITALYSGDAVYLNSASSALTQVVEALRRVMLPVVFK